MKFEEIIKKRKSVRKFKSKTPSWKDILYAIDLANQGPFAGNQNHLHYIIVEDHNTIKALAQLCEQHWVADAKIIIVACSDDTHLENLYGERGRIYSRQQAGAAIHTLTLALTERRIDSCWVGSYSDELVREKLKIPQHIQVEAIIPIGFEAGKSKKPAKKSLERCLSWETWTQTRRPTMFEEGHEDYPPFRG
ncbi:MAG: nitroreductase family protein [Nanoarchaeota archaeon]|nr:nitroreductase family protein [Nanoarchaeota archaeon]MBU0977243.1 nitroreductase family protein [Nanoarchaeota archaeon]